MSAPLTRNEVDEALDRRARLTNWLCKHNGRLLWETVKGRGVDCIVIRCWAVGDGLVIAVLYPRGGFDLYTPNPGDLDIDASFADAERRLGLRSTQKPAKRPAKKRESSRKKL